MYLRESELINYYILGETLQEELRTANALAPLTSLLSSDDLGRDGEYVIQAAAALLAIMSRNRNNFTLPFLDVKSNGIFEGWVRSSIEDKVAMSRLVHFINTTRNQGVLEQSLRVIVNLSAVGK